MDVNKATSAVSAMTEDWDLVDALAGGTRAMRAAGTVYLPKRPLESNEDYSIRLSQATLFPAFSETLANMVGRVFAEPVQPGDDVPEWIEKEVLPDVDRQGNKLHTYARDWFYTALRMGLSYTLVESPRAAGVVTQEQQRQAGIRPYLIHVNPRRVLGWIEKDGKLVQVRIAFVREERDGDFGTKQVQQVRVYEIGRVRTFEKMADRDQWTQVDDVPMALDRIPLVTLYTARTGFMTAKPPLRELAFLNAKHWAQQSSNDTLVDTASVPILALSGVSEGDEVVIGAKHAVRLPSGATMEYVEHTGAAIDAGRTALDSLKQEMRQAGAKLVRSDGATKTPTEAEASEDGKRETTPLGEMATALEAAMGEALDLVAAWRREPDGGSVEVRPNLETDAAPNESMATLMGMHASGMLSKATVFAEAQRRGLVSDEIEWEDEQVRLSEEPMAGETDLTPLPGAGRGRAQ